MLSKIFPFIQWFRNYHGDSLKADAIAGLTVALVLIPQSMAYAQLAGLPAYYGLYAAFLPPMIAALFGSSRQLATGPVAVVSLMTSASLEPLATAGSEGYIAYAILMALMVGIFQLTLGILRLGVIVNFLSHPVVNGFTNAAAIIIATSQLSKLFGVNVENAEHHYETIIRVVEAAWKYTHWPSLIMGISAFAIMYGLKRTAPKIPNVLVAVTITTVISWLMGFECNRMARLSDIQPPRAIEMIGRYNQLMREMPELAEERIRLSRNAEEVKKSGDELAFLEAGHLCNKLNFRIERLREESRTLKDEIRGLLFAGVPQADGSLLFYAKGERPQGSVSDGRVWRIRVGNKPFKPEEISMSGGGAVVGAIPKGLPAFTIPKVDFKVASHLFSYAAIIALLGFMEAISIAKAMAAKTGQRLDPNQELIGQGLANIAGAVGKSYPVSGSFSRSAVNLQAGAVTGLSSVFTSLVVVTALFFFTPLLYHLPESVLAAVIMLAVIGLVNVTGFVHSWRAQWYDGAISVISFIFTLIFAPHLDKGIMIGVALSLAVFLYKGMRPKVSTLSRHEDSSLKCSLTFGLQQCDYIDMVRFEGTLFFANATYLEDKINERLKTKKSLKHIIIVSNGINDMDASGEESLSLTINRVRAAGVDISFTGVNETVMKVLKRTHLFEEIGEDHIYPTMESAIIAVHDSAHRGGKEQHCPLTTVCNIVTHMPSYEEN